MKYVLQTEDKEEFELYYRGPDCAFVLHELSNEARKLWKYSEDEQEVEKGEWLRELLYHLCNERGIEL